ncbi:MAG: purine-nucleoside phosphorylase [Dehalococcoidia bacterium]|nr:purine-nucleoside phosphorylase [Dehalococcoidia bacterium]
MPHHILAEPGDVAPVAILVGDPGRATQISTLLQSARRYNEHRGLLGYTGLFEGARISAQTTGMGGPSAAIVLEELAQLGVRTVIRAGTCGAIGKHVGVLDLVVATAAVPVDGTTRQYLNSDPFAPVADFAVTTALVEAAAASGRPSHTGLLVSEDAFYRQADDWQRWRERGALAVEMEASTVFTVALLRGLRAGCVCLVVNDTSHPGTWHPADTRREAEDALVRVALQAAKHLAA